MQGGNAFVGSVTSPILSPGYTSFSESGGNSNFLNAQNGNNNGGKYNVEDVNSNQIRNKNDNNHPSKTNFNNNTNRQTNSYSHKSYLARKISPISRLLQTYYANFLNVVFGPINITTKSNNRHFRTCKLLVLQAVYLKPLFLLLLHFLHEKQTFTNKRYHLLSTLPLIISMATILHLYRILRPLLIPIEAGKKFIAIKLVIFLLAVQLIIITIMESDDTFHNTFHINLYSTEHRAVRFYCVLGIVEMAVFSSLVLGLFKADVFVDMENNEMFGVTGKVHNREGESKKKFDSFRLSDSFGDEVGWCKGCWGFGSTKSGCDSQLSLTNPNSRSYKEKLYDVLSFWEVFHHIDKLSYHIQNDDADDQWGDNPSHTFGGDGTSSAWPSTGGKANYGSVASSSSEEYFNLQDFKKPFFRNSLTANLQEVKSKFGGGLSFSPGKVSSPIHSSMRSPGSSRRGGGRSSRTPNSPFGSERGSERGGSLGRFNSFADDGDMMEV